jgi:hypothetical protein
MPAQIEKGGEGFKGYAWVTPHSISDDLMQKQEGQELRLIFKVEDEKKQDGSPILVNYGVPVDPERAVIAMMPWLGKDVKLPSGPEAMKDFIARNMPGEKRYARIYNNFIQEYPSPLGTHRGTLVDLRTFWSDKYNQTRISFIVQTTEGFTTTWHAPYSIKCVLAEDPAKDDITFFDTRLDIDYLMTLGLDFKQFVTEINEYHKTNGRLFSRLTLDGQLPGMFQDPADISPELMHAIKRYGPATVEFKIVQEKGYNPGPERQGKYHKVVLKPIVIEGDSGPSKAEAAFQKEAARFAETGERFISEVMATPTRFAVDSTVTQEAIPVLKALIVPLVNRFPQISKKRKEDGTVGVSTVLSAENWTTDGLAALETVMARALAADEKGELPGGKLGDLMEGPMNTKVLQGEQESPLVQWAIENVPTLGFDPAISAEEELL